MLKKRARTHTDPASMSSTTSVPATSDCELADQSNTNVKVVVRVRPENEAEIKSNFSTVVKVLDSHVLVFDPLDDTLPRFERVEAGRFRRPMLTRKRRDLRFAFDCVFDETSSQMEVFENTTKMILDGILDGINCSVFAYGATGAGKTHTMLGSAEQPGVMFHTMMELYRRIEAIKDNKTCEVAVSYLEVYNEAIHDLLQPSRQLALREDAQKGVMVSGLSQHQPKSAEELLQMLKAGNKNRTQHPTEANATSSRSHAVFQVFVHQKARTAGLSAEVTQAKMSLIDLAGSERATVTSNRGARLREGANINKSLLALGNCINALAASKGKAVHIPYRNSKLTRLLKDSLGGNCRTVMIANISPSGHSYEDTYNTLKYADRAKQIKTKLVRNVVNVDFHVTRYKIIVTELRKEVEELKQKLDKQIPVQQSFDVSEAARFQGMLQSVYSERARLRKDMADLDAAERDILLRTFRKERDLHRIELLTANGDKLAKVQAKLDFLRQRLTDVQAQKEQTQGELALNSEAINKVQGEVDTALASAEPASVMALQSHVEVITEARKLEVEGSHQWKQTKHLLKYIKNQEKDISRTEKLLMLCLELIHEQHQVLKRSNGLSSTVDDMYDQLVRMTEGDKEVAWADQSYTDSLHNVSISSFSQSQQTLFNTLVSHSSPLRKAVTDSSHRFSSPSVAASLGILTSTSSSQTGPNQEKPVQSAGPRLPPTSHSVTCHPLTTRLLAQRQLSSATPSTAGVVPEQSSSSGLRTVTELARKVLSSPVTNPKLHRKIVIPSVLKFEGNQKRGEKRPRTPSENSHPVIPSPLSPHRNFPPTPSSTEKGIQAPLISNFTGHLQASMDCTDGGRCVQTPRGRLNLSELTSISSPFYQPVDTSASRSPVCHAFEDNFVSPHQQPTLQSTIAATTVHLQCMPIQRPKPSSSDAFSRPVPSPSVISLGPGATCRTAVASESSTSAFRRVVQHSPSIHHPVAMATGNSHPISMAAKHYDGAMSNTHLFIPVVSPMVPPPPLSAFPVPRHPLPISHPSGQLACQKQSRRLPLTPLKASPSRDLLAQQQAESAQIPSPSPAPGDQLNTTFTISVASPRSDLTRSEESSSALPIVDSQLTHQSGKAFRGGCGARQQLPLAFKPLGNLQYGTNGVLQSRERVGSVSGESLKKVPSYRSLTKSAANKRVQAGQTRVIQKENQLQQPSTRSSGRRHNFTRSGSVKSSKSQVPVH